MRSIITTLILLSILFIGCSKEIEPAYKEVALKYEKYMIRRIYHKPTDKLTEEQEEHYEKFLEHLNPKLTEEEKEHYKERYLERHNFNIKLTQEQKEHYYERFLEYFNSEIKEEFPVGDVSTNAMASYLDDIWNTAIKVIRRYKPEYEDSIHGRLVLSGFSNISYDLDDELLRDARFFDLVNAYTVYLPQFAKEKINDCKYGFVLFNWNLAEPYFWEGASKDVEQMAFAYIRRNILLRKLRDSFSEKQKMYMEENSILFLESLDEKQVKIFREYNKYNEYLK